ncbi:MGDG synthase family glycosyltransferase [Lederbergia citri]|uniref:UDP-glucuronosyltransferase n=1 Tax=Lederbergia citri TaxID=2833580 RepID=A0A942YHM9_9BACI|nr:UDP-glucuronosyltransferase [Lederbergia citri]
MKKLNKSVLFLPFLQIPSGHHQTANALIDGLLTLHPQITCEKIDVLSYSYGKIESLVSNIYLKWIDAFPGLYHFIYQNSVYKNIDKNKRFWLYEYLFISKIKRLLEEKQPDLIICTHALPSYMLNYMKEKDGLTIPVINVYTDFFIHRFWGVKNIDFHFVPSYQMKKFLIQKGIKEEQIFITGIPIHSSIIKQKNTSAPLSPFRLSVLIAGGNLGVGAIEELIQFIVEGSHNWHIKYYVLCGKNVKLYKKLKSMQKSHIIPFPYIDSREEMNRLYDQMDAILTKPGGVTISECLFKRKPIFIYDALPGQEEINLQHLKELGVVYHLNKGDIHEQILSVFFDEKELEKYQLYVTNYHLHINTTEPAKLISDLLIEQLH